MTDVIRLRDTVRGFKVLEPDAANLDDNLTYDLLDETNSMDLRAREITILTARIKVLEAELQQARMDAFQTGFEEGKDIATIQAQEQMEVLSKEFAANMQSLHTQFGLELEKMDKPLIRMALAIAEKIIGIQLDVDERANAILLTQVQKLLNISATQSRAIVHVNPQQLNWIMSDDVMAKLNIPQRENLTFISDDKLRLGECQLETEDLFISSEIQTQLDIIEASLRESNDPARS